MTEPVRNQWAQWLLERRFGGDSGQRERLLQGLIPWRDRILENAAVKHALPRFSTVFSPGLRR